MEKRQIIEPEEIFELVDEQNKRMELIMAKDHIEVKKQNYRRIIQRTALLGCKLYQSYNPEFKNKIVVFYIKRGPKKINKNLFRTSEKRQIISSNYFSTDLKYLKMLKNKIMQLIYKEAPPNEFLCESDMNMYMDESQKKKFEKNKHNYADFKCSQISKLPRSFFSKTDPKTKAKYYKNVMVVINPNSGTKKARKMFQDVSGVLGSNGIRCEVYETRGRGDLISHIKDMDLAKLKALDGFFIFSGDGLVHELINGFATRPDWDMREHPVTLAHFPSGSGCALSENIAKFSNTECSLESVVYAVCHWRTVSLPLFQFKITTHDGSQKVVYGFLSLSLGFFADVDIGSEVLRFMGATRFDVYGAWKFMRMGTIPLRVKWTQVQDKALQGTPNLVESVMVGGSESENQDTGGQAELKEDKTQEEKTEIKVEAEEDETVSPEENSPKFDLKLSSEIPIGFPSDWNEPEYRGKVFSLVALTIPFFSRNYLASPKLLNNLSSINLQLGTSKMGRMKYFKYVMGHENHKQEKHPLLIDVLAKKLEVEMMEDVIKRESGQSLTGHKKNKIELVIDGESYKDLGFRKVEMISTGTYFNVII